MPRVAANLHRRLVPKWCCVEKFGKLAHLAVGQRIHGIDNDGLDAFAGAIAKHVIHDRQNVGQTLARACAGSQHKIGPGASRPDRLILMAMKPHGMARAVGFLLSPKYLCTRLVKNLFGDQLVDRGTGFKRWVELNQGRRPEQATAERLLDFVLQPLVCNLDKATDKGIVVVDQPVPHFENVHAYFLFADRSPKSLRFRH